MSDRASGQLEMEPAERLAALRAAMPTDPRCWWIGEETDEMISTWERIGLPPLVMHDAEGDRLTLWTIDLTEAATMLGLPISGEGDLVIEDGDYRLFVEELDNEKHLKETSDGASA
jgi:hypothetical protein